MSTCARIATLLLLAVHLAAASAPCPSATLPDHEPESGAIAGAAAHPCPAHADAGSAASTWFDPLCPCGCESGAPPGANGSRIPPALLVARLTALCATNRVELTCAPLQLAPMALAPPDHVPLAVA
jgi:hypothetical protein